MRSRRSRGLVARKSIPQLVFYTRSGKGWRRSQLTGVHEPKNIRQFIRNEIDRQRAAGGGERRPLRLAGDELDGTDRFGP